MFGQFAGRACDRIRREPLQKAGVGHSLRLQIEQIDAFDSADAAAGPPGQRAALLLQRDERLLYHLELDFGVRQLCVVMQFDFDVLNVAAALDDPFRNRESDRERFEIARRAHHHRMRNTVEDERDRPLLPDMIGDGFDRRAAMPVHPALHRARLSGVFLFVQCLTPLPCRATASG